LSRAKKPLKKADFREIVYGNGQWKLLRKLRLKAVRIMETLEKAGLPVIIHGSLARGDVNERSDIDVVIPQPTPSFKVELILERGGFHLVDRLLVQATPRHIVKAHIYLDELTTVTFPMLVNFSRLERDFYKFGGELSLKELKDNRRVPGVDKRLMLILPTDKGHFEVSIIGRENEAAKIIGVTSEIIRERIRVLLRRDTVGRTGVYLKYRLKPEENFEEAFRRLAVRDPGKRRMLHERGYF
jgi:hypothetical protein